MTIYDRRVRRVARSRPVSRPRAVISALTTGAVLFVVALAFYVGVQRGVLTWPLAPVVTQLVGGTAERAAQSIAPALPRAVKVAPRIAVQPAVVQPAPVLAPTSAPVAPTEQPQAIAAPLPPASAAAAAVVVAPVVAEPEGKAAGAGAMFGKVAGRGGTAAK